MTIGAGALIYNLATPAKITIENEKLTSAALAQARDALIGYASGQQTLGSFRPGELPCPDSNNDGTADSSCNTAASRIGRLPWKTLGLPDLRDGAGERLWYAVSDVYKNATQTGILNSDTPGDYTVTGTTPATNVIAVVFAPGAVVGTQVRDTANANTVANYLEGQNADGDTTFTTGPASATFNDRLLLVTQDVLFPAVTARVARELRSTLNSYYSTYNYFPSATPFADSTYTCSEFVYEGRLPISVSTGCTSQAEWTAPSWFIANNWHQLTFYSFSWLCSEWIATFLGSWWCTSINIQSVYNATWSSSTSARAVVIVTGRALTGQARPCTTATHCIDHNENTDADGVFYAAPVSATNNDRVVVVAP